MDPNFDMSTDKKVEHAIKMISTFSKNRDFKIGFSGGKDSVVLRWLCLQAKVPANLVYCNTTIDPPGTIEFCRKLGAEILQPRYSFLQLVEKKGFPTMFRRFCCSELKERFIGEFVMTGVRKAESVKRNKRYCSFENDKFYSKKLVSHQFTPLIYFTDNDIDNIINQYQLQCHPLYYDEFGHFHVERRLGCIGCPLQGDRGVSDFQRYPKLLRAIIRAGLKFHHNHGRSDKDCYENLVYNLFYSNHNYKKYEQAFNGLFDTDAKAIIESKFCIQLP